MADQETVFPSLVALQCRMMASGLNGSMGFLFASFYARLGLRQVPGRKPIPVTRILVYLIEFSGK